MTDKETPEVAILFFFQKEAKNIPNQDLLTEGHTLSL